MSLLENPVPPGPQGPGSFEPQTGIQLGDPLTHGTRMMECHTSKFVVAAGGVGVSNNSTTIFTNTNHRGAHFIIEVGVNAAVPNAVFQLWGLYYRQPNVTLNAGSPLFTDYLLLESPVINTDSLTVMKIYPGISPSPNVRANDVLPQQWYFRYISNQPGGTDIWNFNISANMLY